MPLCIVMACYVYIAMALLIVTSQWNNNGHPQQHHYPLCCHNEFWKLKVLLTGAISKQSSAHMVISNLGLYIYRILCKNTPQHDIFGMGYKLKYDRFYYLRFVIQERNTILKLIHNNKKLDHKLDQDNSYLSMNIIVCYPAG